MPTDHESQIQSALESLIHLVRAMEREKGEPCRKLEVTLDVRLGSGKTEEWYVEVGRVDQRRN